MKHLYSLAAFTVVLFALSSPLHAQNGRGSMACASSPENPTAILALVGSAGAGIATLRDRLKSRSRKQ